MSDEPTHVIHVRNAVLTLGPPRATGDSPEWRWLAKHGARVTFDHSDGVPGLVNVVVEVLAPFERHAAARILHQSELDNDDLAAVTHAVRTCIGMLS